MPRKKKSRFSGSTFFDPKAARSNVSQESPTPTTASSDADAGRQLGHSTLGRGDSRSRDGRAGTGKGGSIPPHSLGYYTGRFVAVNKSGLLYHSYDDLAIVFVPEVGNAEVVRPYKEDLTQAQRGIVDRLSKGWEPWNNDR